jgi:hypothetical protein
MKRFMMYLAFVVVAATTVSAQTDFAAELQQLDKAVRGARSLTEQEPFVLQLVSLGARAFAVDEFDVAVTAYDYAYRICRTNRPAEALMYKQRMDKAKMAAREYVKLSACMGKDDAASKRKLAEFQAFVKGEWAAALPVLAEGSDLVAKAAQLDLQHLGVEEEEAVADAWVAAAKGNSANAAVLYARAGYWYNLLLNQQASPQLLKKMQTLGAKIGNDPYSVLRPRSWQLSGRTGFTTDGCLELEPGRAHSARLNDPVPMNFTLTLEVLKNGMFVIFLHSGNAFYDIILPFQDFDNRVGMYLNGQSTGVVAASTKGMDWNPNVYETVNIVKTGSTVSVRKGTTELFSFSATRLASGPLSIELGSYSGSATIRQMSIR